jgi:putative membrane protein
LSRVSYTLIFLFLCFHEIGAHFTYGRVPYDDLFRRWFGTGFNDLVGWERNNYDRVVHFLYGLMLAYPVREIFLRVANARGFWGYFLPLDLTCPRPCLRTLERATAVVLGNGAMDYLGTQGDPWDAHKDMALASSALCWRWPPSRLSTAISNAICREWNESLRVKHRKPLGEEEAARTMAGSMNSLFEISAFVYHRQNGSELYFARTAHRNHQRWINLPQYCLFPPA